jgi:hypothetical protein
MAHSLMAVRRGTAAVIARPFFKDSPRRGTKSSNPSPSSGESIANLTAAYMVGGLFAFMMLSAKERAWCDY